MKYIFVWQDFITKILNTGVNTIWTFTIYYIYTLFSFRNSEKTNLKWDSNNFIYIILLRSTRYFILPSSLVGCFQVCLLPRIPHTKQMLIPNTYFSRLKNSHLDSN